MLNKVSKIPIQAGKFCLAEKNTILLLTVILSLLFGLSCKTQAQVFVKVNYNFFNMSDLKDFQRELLSDLTNQGIEAQITESYPAYYGFQFGLIFPLSSSDSNDIWIGGFFDYATTGGRVHYSDYSGEVKADQVAKAYSVGGIISLRATDEELFKLDLSLNARFIFSDLENEFLIRVGDEEQKENYSFSSFSFGVEPAIVPSIALSNFTLGLSVSYLLSLPTALEYSKYNDAYLVNQNGDRVSIDWSGLKLGLLVNYSF